MPYNPHGLLATSNCTWFFKDSSDQNNAPKLLRFCQNFNYNLQCNTRRQTLITLLFMSKFFLLSSKNNRYYWQPTLWIVLVGNQSVHINKAELLKVYLYVKIKFDEACLVWPLLLIQQLHIEQDVFLGAKKPNFVQVSSLYVLKASCLGMWQMKASWNPVQASYCATDALLMLRIFLCLPI